MGCGQPAVLAREDVVNLKLKVVVLLRHPAVLTDVLSAPPDETFESKVHSSALVGAADLLERLTGSRLHEGQHMTYVLVVVQLDMFFERQRTIPSLLR